jgi:hypothetical protein
MLRPDRVCLVLVSVVFVAVFGGVMVGCGGSSLATYAGLRPGGVHSHYFK